MKILFIFGPNLGQLGTRDPDRYGTQTIEQIMDEVADRAASLGHEVAWRQSDAEAELVGWVRGARSEGFGAIVMNPGALSHYSHVLRDGVEACGLPFVEVHMTNIHAREPFRRTSVISPVASCVIAGAGAGVYHLAVEGLPWITR